MLQGTLLRGIGSFYTVLGEDGATYTLRCKKKIRRVRLSPVAGDRVRFEPGEGEEDGWLEEILPRTSQFIRPPVANVSLMLLVAAPVPSPDLLLIDRLLVQCRMQGLKTLLVVTKADLDAELPERLRKQYRGADCPVCAVSAKSGLGLEELREAMRGEICCLAGQSGVGKSTLLNALLGTQLETGEISRKISRGKNTTRAAELLVTGGLTVMDTAGFSLLELTGAMDPVTLKDFYPEFLPAEGQCRFQPCLHDREPGCAVTAACAGGEVDAERLARYRQLLQSVREAWKDRYHSS